MYNTPGSKYKSYMHDTFVLYLLNYVSSGSYLASVVLFKDAHTVPTSLSDCLVSALFVSGSNQKVKGTC